MHRHFWRIYFKLRVLKHRGLGCNRKSGPERPKPSTDLGSKQYRGLWWRSDTGCGFWDVIRCNVCGGTSYFSNGQRYIIPVETSCFRHRQPFSIIGRLTCVWIRRRTLFGSHVPQRNNESDRPESKGHGDQIWKGHELFWCWWFFQNVEMSSKCFCVWHCTKSTGFCTFGWSNSSWWEPHQYIFSWHTYEPAPGRECE